jgi:hypothetical protein
MKTGVDQTQLKRKLLRHYLLLLLATASLVLWHLWDGKASLVEQVYAPYLYPTMASAIIFMTGRLPFSLAAGAFMALLVVLIVNLIMRRHRIEGQHWAIHWLVLGHLPIAIMVYGYLTFILLWGANYERPSLIRQLDLANATITTDDLNHLSEVLLAMIQANREHERQPEAALEALRINLEEMSRTLAYPSPRLPTAIKSLPPGLLLRWANTAGVVSPWTLEAHVDSALAETTWLALAGHELAHLAGYADEGEASLMAALAGLNADHSYTRYALALHVFMEVTATLPTDLRQDYYARLPRRAQQDYQQVMSQFQAYLPPAWLLQTQRRLYHQYLKSQGVSAGINSYSEVIQHLVLAHDKGLF